MMLLAGLDGPRDEAVVRLPDFDGVGDPAGEIMSISEPDRLVEAHGGVVQLTNLRAG